MVALTIPTPADFRFRGTVESHGWCVLAPNRYDYNTGTLRRRERLPDGLVVDLRMRGGRARVILIDVQSHAVLSSRQRQAISYAVERLFNVGWNLVPFYDLMRKTDGYAWVDERKTARLLASPTVWEDLVKTLFTTNITWSGTKEMVRKLVELDPAGTFPSPRLVASFSETELAAATGAGYRTAYLLDLAQRCASGQLDLESWRSLDTAALYKEIIDLRGFGDYAAGNAMRLLGHFDRPAIDTVARKAYEERTGHSAENDAEIRRHYEQFGNWAGLVLWMDCIRDEPEPAEFIVNAAKIPDAITPEP